MLDRKRIIPVKNRKCAFCIGGTVPSYVETSALEKYLTERAKIIPAGRSSTCAKHQRLIAREIKRARHMGMLPFLNRF